MRVYMDMYVCGLRVHMDHMRVHMEHGWYPGSCGHICVRMCAWICMCADMHVCG